MRSATSITSGTLWLITTTASPASRTRPIRSSTCCVWATPSAAVGSSMKITRFAHTSARATATHWRWPPENSRIGAFSDGQVDRQAVQVLGRLALHAALVELAEAPPRARLDQVLAAEEEVLRRRQVVGQREVLIDGLDAELTRVDRGLEVGRLAVDLERALVRAQRARQALHERRLAGAVVAHQRHDLARRDLERDVVERGDVAEELGDVVGRQRGTGGDGAHPSSSVK